MQSESKPRHCRSSLATRLLNLKQSAILSDVTVLCGEHISIQAHRCILSASSLYFKAIFTDSEGASLNTVDLSKEIIDTAYIDTVIEYIYTGCIDLIITSVAGIVRLASFLKCSELLEICQDFTDGILDTRNCLQLYLDLHHLELARDDGVKRMVSKVWNMIEKSLNTDEVLQQQILEISSDGMIHLLSGVTALCLPGHKQQFLQLAVTWLYNHQHQTALVEVAEFFTTVILKDQEHRPCDVRHVENCVSRLVEVLKKGDKVPAAGILIFKLEKYLGNLQRNGDEGLLDLVKESCENEVFEKKNHKDTDGDYREECSEIANHYDSDTDDLEGETESKESVSGETCQPDDRGKSFRRKQNTSFSNNGCKTITEFRQSKVRGSFTNKNSEVRMDGMSENFNCVKSRIELHVGNDELCKGAANASLHTEPKSSEKDSDGESMSTGSLDGDSPDRKTYLCSLCDKKLDKPRSLHRHNDKYKARSEQCMVCGRSFAHAYHMLVHIRRRHKDVKSFKCAVCSETIGHLKNRDQHVKTHKEPRKSEAFVSPKTDEVVNKVFTCDPCDKTFTRKAGYQKHMMIHTGERPFTCGECGTGFRTKYKLKWHRDRVHIGVSVKEFKCGQCGFKFCDKNNFEKHTQNCEGKKLVCETCGKKFLYQVELDRHVVSHSDARTNVCDQCPRRFKHVQNLKAHVLLKHQNIDKVTRPSICDHCGKVLKNRSCLRRHLLTHEAERPYKCPQCPKSYTQSTGLDVHMRLHTGDKPYQCEICSEMFVVKCNLDRHIQRHLGDKPHKCDQCDKAFVQITDLKRHQTVHTGEKKFSCRFCGKLFALKKSIPVHERIHTGERPYKCTSCRKSFLTRSDLKRHEKTHLKDKPNTRLKQEAVENTIDNRSRSGIPPVVNFMENYPTMDRMGLQPVSVNRNEMPTENAGLFISPFPNGFY